MIRNFLHATKRKGPLNFIEEGGRHKSETQEGQKNRNKMKFKTQLGIEKVKERSEAIHKPRSVRFV